MIFQECKVNWDKASKDENHSISDSTLTHSGHKGIWSTSLVEGPVGAGDKIAFRIKSRVKSSSIIMVGLASKQVASCNFIGQEEKSFGYYGFTGNMFYFNETKKECEQKLFGKSFKKGDLIELRVNSDSVEFLLN